MKKILILELLKEKKYKEIHNELMQLNDIDVRGCIYFLVHCFIYFI